MLQLGKSINQLSQKRRDFRNLSVKDVTKPLAYLIANCARMYVIKSQTCGIPGGHW
jgi:hypothetical protein